MATPIDLNGAASALLQGLAQGGQARAREEELRLRRAALLAQNQARAVDDQRQQQALQLQQEQFEQQRAAFRAKIDEEESRRSANSRLLGAFGQMESYVPGVDPATGAPTTPPEGTITDDDLLRADPNLSSQFMRARGAAKGQSSRLQTAMRQVEAMRQTGKPEYLRAARGVHKILDEFGVLHSVLRPDEMPKSEQEMADQNQKRQQLAWALDMGVPETLPSVLGPLPNPDFEAFLKLPPEYAKLRYARFRKEEQEAQQRAEAEREAQVLAQNEAAAVAAGPSVGIPSDSVSGALAMRRAGLPVTPEAPKSLDPQVFDDKERERLRGKIKDAEAQFDNARQALLASGVLNKDGRLNVELAKDRGAGNDPAYTTYFRARAAVENLQGELEEVGTPLGVVAQLRRRGMDKAQIAEELQRRGLR